MSVPPPRPPREANRTLYPTAPSGSHGGCSFLRTLRVWVSRRETKHALVNTLDLPFALRTCSQARTWAPNYSKSPDLLGPSLCLYLPLWKSPFDLCSLKLDSSSRSATHRLRFADLLSLLACRLRSSLSSPSPCSTGGPGWWARAMASAGGFGAPCAPLANQAAAGCLTCSFQKVSSSARALKQAVHGSSSEYSRGGISPAATPTRWIF